jgi:hypothetical protein
MGLHTDQANGLTPEQKHLAERVAAFLADLRNFEQFLPDADLGRTLTRFFATHPGLVVRRDLESEVWQAEVWAGGRGGPLKRAMSSDLKEALEELLGRPRPGKRCYRCRQVKPLNQFSRRLGEYGGNIYCLVCERRRVKAYTVRKQAAREKAAREKAAREKAAAPKAGRARPARKAGRAPTS